MSLTVALTGATGFVGQKILPRLLAAGHNVRALARHPQLISSQAGVQVIAGDLANRDSIFALVSGADVVLHVAGAIKGARNRDFFRVNTDGTRELAEAARAGGARRLVFVSSLAARRPEVSAYAASKREAEDWLRSKAMLQETLILRPAAIYGEGDMATLPLIAALMSRVAVLPGLASSRFSLIHADDFAAVCTDAVASGATGLREVDDTAGGHGWQDLANITQRLYGRPSRRFHLPRPLAMGLGLGADLWSATSGRPAMLSAGKMREFYQPDWIVEGEGWPRSSVIRLAEGLPRTIRWYQAQGLLPPLHGGDRSPAAERKPKT